jgi:uncharacterized protein YjbJ (UPF0337 family)
MDTNQLKGNWDFIKGKIKEKWGKLTDDDLTEIGGKKDQLVGKIEHRYGVAKEEAEKQVNEFED